MEIKIGANIKRMRREHGITQEQLANVLNVSCAAVSKWETGDTYPDITLIFPISHFFKVSVDELMGYDLNLIEKEIQDVIQEYGRLREDFKYDEAKDLMKKAREKYPNDYKIMIRYMFEISGGLADNDPQILRDNATEINEICNTVLSNCNDEILRLEAITMQAKVLHAEAKTEEALKLLNSFPSFYHASGQRIEQLYLKNTDEFYKQLKLNMYELADFTANKLAKSIFYNKELTKEEKANLVLKIGRTYNNYYNDNDFDVFVIFANMFWGESLAKARWFAFDNNTIIECCNGKYESAKSIAGFIQKNTHLKNYFKLSKNIDTNESYLNISIKNSERSLPEAILKDSKYIEMVKKYITVK